MPANLYAIGGDIEIKHNPDADINTKTVTVYFMDCTKDQKPLNVPESSARFEQKLEGDYERWVFGASVEEPQSAEILLNFSIKYKFFNKRTNQWEEYEDNNNSLNYTMGINIPEIPSVTLGKSVIAFYDTVRIPRQGYGKGKLAEVSYYVKNGAYHKDGGLHLEEYGEWSWHDTPESWAHWVTGFAKAKNQEELWKITPPADDQPEDPILFCVYCNYNDGNRFYDNNFNKNYYLYDSH